MSLHDLQARKRSARKTFPYLATLIESITPNVNKDKVTKKKTNWGFLLHETGTESQPFKFKVGAALKDVNGLCYDYTLAIEFQLCREDRLKEWQCLKHWSADFPDASKPFSVFAVVDLGNYSKR